MEKYNIIFATDQNYIEHLSVAIYSLLENNKELDFNIYIINSGIDNETYKQLELIASNYNCKLNDVVINDEIFKQLVTNHHFTSAMYYRLLIPKFIQDDKVLYLDADIVVNNTIVDLYNTDINDFYIASVENPGFNRHEELQMNKNANYFNSGVMLINVKKWREEELQARVIDFIDNNSNIVKSPDQDGLNAIINGNWKKIQLKYNQQAVIFEKNFDDKYHCFSQAELKEAKEDPIIIHYTGSSKPWHFRNNHPYKKLYWKYLRMTPFKKYIPEDLTLINVIKWMIPKSIKEFIKGRAK